MWTILVVIPGVRVNDVIKLPKAKTEKMIQALSLEAADPSLNK